MRRRGPRFKEFQLKGISLKSKKAPPTYTRSTKTNGYTTLNNFLTKALPNYEKDMKQISWSSKDHELERLLNLEPEVFRPSPDKKFPPITLTSRHRSWRSDKNELSSEFFMKEPIPRTNVPVPTKDNPLRSSPNKAPSVKTIASLFPKKAPLKAAYECEVDQSCSGQRKHPQVKEKASVRVAPKIPINADADFGTVHDILSNIFPKPVGALGKTPVFSIGDEATSIKKPISRRSTLIRNLHKARDQMKAKKMALPPKSPLKKTRPKIKKRQPPRPPPPPKPKLQKEVCCVCISPSLTRKNSVEMDIQNLVCSVSNKVFEAGVNERKSTKRVHSRLPKSQSPKPTWLYRISPKRPKVNSVRCKLIISINTELAHRRLEYRKAVRAIVSRLRDLESKQALLVPGKGKKSRKKRTRGKGIPNIGKGTNGSQFHIRILEDLIHRVKLRMYFIAMRNAKDLSITRADLVKKVCRRENVILLRLAFETWHSLARHRIKKKESAKKMWEQKQSELVYLVMFHWKTLLGPIKERRLGEEALRKWLANRRQRYYLDAWIAVYAIRKFNRNLEIASIKYNITRQFQRWRVNAARQCFLRYRLCEAQGRPMERSTLMKYLADACVEFKLKLKKPAEWQNWRDCLREERYGQEKHRYALRKWRNALLIIPPDDDAHMSLEDLAANLFKKRLVKRCMKSWRAFIRGEMLLKATARILKRHAFRKTREFATFQKVRSEKCSKKARLFQLRHRFQSWRWFTKRLRQLRDDVLLDVYPCARKTRYFRRWRKWLARIHALEGMADIVIKQQRLHCLCEHFFRLKGIYLWRKHDRALVEQLEKQEDLVTRLYIQRKHFDTWNTRVKSGKRMKIRNIHNHLANVKSAISIKKRFMGQWIEQYNRRRLPPIYSQAPKECTTKLLKRDQTTSPHKAYAHPTVEVVLSENYSPELGISGRNFAPAYTDELKLGLSRKKFIQTYNEELRKEPVTPINNLLRNVLDYKLLRPTKEDILKSYYGSHSASPEMVDSVILKSPNFKIIVKSPRGSANKLFYKERRFKRKNLDLGGLKFNNSWDSLLIAPLKVRRRRSTKLLTNSRLRPKVHRLVFKKRPKAKRIKARYRVRTSSQKRARIVKRRQRRTPGKARRKK